MNDSTERRYEILVAMDFTDLSDRALEHAIALASHHDQVRLHVVTVGSSANDSVRLPGNKSVTPHATDHVKAHVLEQVEIYRKEHGSAALPAVVVYVALGKLADKIVSLARVLDVDLIVMGTHGRHGVRRALEGSVAEEVVRESDCGVFVVHEKTKRPPERSIPPPPPEIEILVEI
jgi:nucleotide-binding universal stress UspA family protein